MTASFIFPCLWVGSEPQVFEDLSDFDVLVLAAVENRQAPASFRGRVIQCSIEDRKLTEPDKTKVLVAARNVADELYAGNRVLCTCIMGWNRSALVAAVALKMSTSLPCQTIIEEIRNARGEDALSNPSFVNFIYEAPSY